LDFPANNHSITRFTGKPTIKCTLNTLDQAPFGGTTTFTLSSATLSERTSSVLVTRESEIPLPQVDSAALFLRRNPALAFCGMFFMFLSFVMESGAWLPGFIGMALLIAYCLVKRQYFVLRTGATELSLVVETDKSEEARAFLSKVLAAIEARETALLRGSDYLASG
jgi:hypothetical protein